MSTSLPSSLVIGLGTLNTPLTIDGIGVVWDLGINEQGFLLSTLDQLSPFEFRSLAIDSAPGLRPRIETSEEPGENTLDQWWVRAQHSFHQGAGQKIFDSADSSRFRFWNSKGVNPWTLGELSLHKDTFTIDSGSFTDYQVLAENDVLFMAENGIVWKIPDIDTYPTGATSDDLAGPGAGVSTVQSMASDGRFLYVCWAPAANAGIRKIDMTGDWTVITGTLVNDLDPELMRFVKNRLMCAKGPDLFQITNLGSTVAPTAFFTHIYSNWIWTSITQAAPAIFVSGYSGKRSEIYAIGLDVSTLGSGAILRAPQVAWEAPEGEIIYSLQGFLGTSLVIGTSRGVRVGVVDTDGNLTVLPLIALTPEPVRALEPEQDYVYFGWSKFDATDGGIGKLYMGDFSYASDLMAAYQNNVSSIAVVKSRPVFALTGLGTNRVVGQHATNLVASGFLETGEIRFGNFNNKTLRFFDALLTPVGQGSITLQIKKDLGSYETAFSGLLAQEFQESLSLVGKRFAAKITLTRQTTTTGPTLMEWRFRADPEIPTRVVYSVPIMVYDFMYTLNQQQVGFVGYSNYLTKVLTEWYKTRAIVSLRLPSSETEFGIGVIKARMEDFQFKAFAPPQNASGLGGIFLAIFKEIV